MKACTKCSVLKDLSGFNVDRTKKDGFHSICKVCHSVHNKNKRLTNSIWVEQARLKSKLWREIYPERSRETIINATYKKKYGISLSEYNATLEHQNYVCAICNQPENHIDKRRGKVKRLAVDHSHSTGKVRGLLCQGCNVSLGKMKDSPTLLRAAANYLEDRDRQ